MLIVESFVKMGKVTAAALCNLLSTYCIDSSGITIFSITIIHLSLPSKLLVAGDKTSAVKVFDIQTKSLLREMKRHTAAVRCCSWSADGLRVFSGSDDRHALCWDLATEQALFSTPRDSHTDYIRALDASSVNPDLFATGSYDHSVKVWDCRQDSSSPAISSITLNHPVQSCMFTPSGTMLLVASGSEVRIFDLLSGGRLLHRFDNHQKQVTALCMDGTR